MSRIFFVSLIAAMLTCLLISCTKDKSPAACSANFNFNAELNDEANALSVAAQAYTQDQSTANCNAYKDAYTDYLNAARDLEDCAKRQGQEAEYMQAINEAQAAIDNLQC